MSNVTTFKNDSGAILRLPSLPEGQTWEVKYHYDGSVEGGEWELHLLNEEGISEILYMLCPAVEGTPPVEKDFQAAAEGILRRRKRAQSVFSWAGKYKQV